MRRIAIPLLLLLVTAAATHADEDAKPIDPPAVDAAIERGADWLLDEQRPNGSWNNSPGSTVLATFALLHAGVREDAPKSRGKRMRHAWKWLERFGPDVKASEKTQTYATSLLLLALDVRGRQEDRARMQRLTDALVGGQAANGQWTYTLKPGERVGDNSNTQFAVLALGVAWGTGLRVSREAIEHARAWWQDSPHERGGFSYASGGSKASGRKASMTAAGICSLAILDSALLRSDAAPTAAALLLGNGVLRGAYESLASDFALRPKAVRTRRKGKRTAGQSWPHYYLWTVERALVLLGVTQINQIAWFDAGTRLLLESQKKDGSWRGEAPLYATSFALLFLTRAADPPRVFTKSAPITGESKPPMPKPEAVAGSVSEWLQSDVAVRDIVQRCRARGSTSLRELVSALDGSDRKVRQRAFEALSQLLPSSRLHGVDRHPLPRSRLRWWLRRHAPSLHPGSDGRFQAAPQ